MVMDVDKKYMAIMAVVCFMVVSAGFVSILDDADAAGDVSVVSYDSREGKGGQLVLNASTTPVLHTAVINTISFSGKHTPGKALEMTRAYDAELSKSLGAGTYSGIELKNTDGTVGTFDLSLYNVEFDANGGTGTVDSFVAYGDVSLPDGTGLTTPEASKTFLGWSDVSTATAAKYTGTIDVKSNVTLYAVWGTAATTNFTVTVKSDNEAYGTVDPTTILNVPYGTQVTKASNVLNVGGKLVEAKYNDPTPEFTYSFKEWESGDGIVDGKVVGNATIKAVFEETRNTYTVTVNVKDPTTGYVRPTAVADVSYGTLVDLSKNPLTINGVSVEATPALKTAEFTFSFEKWEFGDGFDGEKVVGNATINAVFKKTTNTYTVTVVSKDAEKGTVSLNEVVVLYGSVISTNGNVLTVGDKTVTATPNDKTDKFTYSFVDWSKNATGTVIGDMTIVADFKVETNKYPVTVKVNDSTMGSATFYLNGEKKDSGTEIEYGKTVTLSISQEKGYMLKSVNHNGNNLYTYKEGEEIKLVYYIDVKVENELEVEFIKTSDMQFTVTLKCIGNGSIIPGADGKCVLKGESSQDFLISADFGYKIKSVTLDGIKQDFGKVSAVVPIKNIDAVHKIFAEFEKADTYSVQLIGPSNGKVEVTGLDADGRAVEGRSITITATPDFGFYASRFLVNGVDIDTTTGAVSESRTISVDKSLDGDKIVVEVKFALAASGDEEDDPTPSPPTPAPQTGGDDGKDEAVKVAAVAAACVAVVVIALYMVVWRKD